MISYGGFVILRIFMIQLVCSELYPWLGIWNCRKEQRQVNILYLMNERCTAGTAG